MLPGVLQRPASLASSGLASLPFSRPSSHSSSSRPGTSSRALSRLDLDAAFFWLLLVALVTVGCFLALREPHVELNPKQIAEYERRTQTLSNSTVYIVEVHRPEGLLSALSPDDWARVSRGIDYVAYVYDDLPAFLSDDWMSSAERILSDPASSHGARFRSGLGILLFPCGCILPSAYFRSVSQRLGGMECLLLPGWVLPHGDVHWLADDEKAGTGGMQTCVRQKRISAGKVVAEYAAELGAIRRVLEGMRSSHADRVHAELVEKGGGGLEIGLSAVRDAAAGAASGETGAVVGPIAASS